MLRSIAFLSFAVAVSAGPLRASEGWPASRLRTFSHNEIADFDHDIHKAGDELELMGDKETEHKTTIKGLEEAKLGDIVCDHQGLQTRIRSLIETAIDDASASSWRMARKTSIIPHASLSQLCPPLCSWRPWSRKGLEKPYLCWSSRSVCRPAAQGVGWNKLEVLHSGGSWRLLQGFDWYERCRGDRTEHLWPGVNGERDWEDQQEPGWQVQDQGVNWPGQVQDDLTSDKENVEVELCTVAKCLKKIEDECIAKPDTYEDRMARLEAEIAGFKESLIVLESGTSPAAPFVAPSITRCALDLKLTWSCLVDKAMKLSRPHTRLPWNIVLPPCISMRTCTMTGYNDCVSHWCSCICVCLCIDVLLMAHWLKFDWSGQWSDERFICLASVAATLTQLWWPATSKTMTHGNNWMSDDIFNKWIWTPFIFLMAWASLYRWVFNIEICISLFSRFLHGILFSKIFRRATC